MRTVVSHCDGFCKTFGFIINTARANGIHVADIVFGLRMNEGVAIHFRSRCQQEARTFALGNTQRIVSSQRTHFQRLDRVHEIVNWACR